MPDFDDAPNDAATSATARSDTIDSQANLSNAPRISTGSVSSHSCQDDLLPVRPSVAPPHDEPIRELHTDRARDDEEAQADDLRPTFLASVAAELLPLTHNALLPFRLSVTPPFEPKFRADSWLPLASAL